MSRTRKALMLVAACIPCCLPLIIALAAALAGGGVVALFGGLAAGVLVALAAGLLVLAWRRRRTSPHVQPLPLYEEWPGKP